MRKSSDVLGVGMVDLTLRRDEKTTKEDVK